MKKITFCCALTLLILATGCSGQKKNDATLPADVTAKAKAIREDADFEAMSPSDLAKYQRDVRISARYEGGAVRVNVRNMTQKAIGIQYHNFALLLPGQKQTVDPTPGRGFPQVLLQPGEFATGLVSFGEINNPVGTYCVFHHSQTQSSRCLVRPAKSAAASTTDEATSTITAKDPVVKKTKALPSKASVNTPTSRAAISQKKANPGTVKQPSEPASDTQGLPNPLGD